MPERILLVEDEPGIVDFIQRGLEAHEFEVTAALDGVSGTDMALQDNVDLVVLDMMLPGRSGLEVLARLRQAKPGLPVIALTARGEIEDRVAGLDAGAVDYLTKPFSLSELAARIRAQLRASAQARVTELEAGDIEVNLITRRVRCSGELVRLSTTEFEVLVYLLRNQGRVLAREQIFRAVWGYDFDPGTNVVDVYVGYVRRKLQRARKTSASRSGRTQDSPEAQIVTVRSVGYRLDVAN